MVICTTQKLQLIAVISIPLNQLPLSSTNHQSTRPKNDPVVRK